MKLKEYFVRGKNYFIAVLAVTGVRAFASVLALYPIKFWDPFGVINLAIVGYAGYKLRLKIKESAVLGVLMMLSTAWYIFFMLPGNLFMIGLAGTISTLLISMSLNAGIYAGAAALGCLAARKRKVIKS